MRGKHAVAAVIAVNLFQPLEEAGDGRRIAAGGAHQLDGAHVRLAFRRAGIGQGQKTAALGEDILDSGADVASDQHDQPGDAGGAVELAQAVLLFDMADFMAEHAEDHVGIALGEFDELVGEDQAAVRQGEGVGADIAAIAKIQRIGACPALGLCRQCLEPIADTPAVGLRQLAG